MLSCLNGLSARFKMSSDKSISPFSSVLSLCAPMHYWKPTILTWPRYGYHPSPLLHAKGYYRVIVFIPALALGRKCDACQTIPYLAFILASWSWIRDLVFVLGGRETWKGFSQRATLMQGKSTFNCSFIFASDFLCIIKKSLASSGPLVHFPR